MSLMGKEVMLPLVTVYITNYNYGNYISKAIESVLKQTFQEFEIIIIDDGSIDNSKEIISRYESLSKISVIYQQNKGLTISNNIAISVAKGQFIMRLDADDYLDPIALKLLYSEFEIDPELGMLFGDWYEVDEFDNITSIERRHDFNSQVSLMDQPAHGACTMFRLSYLRELQGYDETLTRQDGYELWFRFIKKYKIKSLNIPIFYYRKHSNNLTSDESLLLEARANALEKHGRIKQGKNSTISIIPVRGAEIDYRSQPFAKIGDKFLIDFTVEAMLSVSNIRNVIVTSPSKDVIEYISDVYKRKGVIGIYREPSLARINMSIAETINHVLKSFKSTDEINTFFLSTIETPFKKVHLMESALNIKKIFNVDTVIGVIPKKDMLFQHHGDGLVPISNHQSILRLEREQLYNYVPGYTLCDIKSFNRTGQILAGKIGHISIDQKAALTVRTQLDLEIAEFLYCTSKINN